MSLEAVVTELQKLNQIQATKIEFLEARVLELEERLKMNSKNSSQPPGSDRFKHNIRPKPKSEKKRGGQPGHKGSHLPLSDTPDEVVSLVPANCSGCGSDLTEVAAEPEFIRRQVVDLPEQKPLKVKEYRAKKVVCPVCGKQNVGIFPDHVKAPVQYGSELLSILMLLVHRHGIPYQRVASLTTELFGAQISPGTVVSATKKLALGAKNAVQAIAFQLKTEAVVHLDETGLRTAGKTRWVHVMCSTTDSHLFLSDRRGFEGINIHLEDFKGIAIHDGWKSYQKFECRHGLCNAHHLRELKFLFEIQGHQWAEDFSKLLLSAYQQTKEGIISVEDQSKIREEAQMILSRARAEHPPPEPKPVGKRGRTRKSKALNLIERLENYADQVWLFITDPKVPFDNNQAERDIRMLKVMQKIKGCFRTVAGAEQHLTIRSLILSAQKKEQDLLLLFKQVLQPAP